MSLHNLNRALLLGCVLVIVVLIVFLYDWRTALISLTAIPLSLLAAALVLRYRGGTLNTMVLAGLVIALGEVVDDAIIDVENIVRRLRLNAAAGNPQPRFQVVLDASLEVRSAVVYASLIVVAGVPAGVLPGRTGRLVLPAAGTVLRAGDPGVAARGADGHAGAVADAAAAHGWHGIATPPLVALAEDALSRDAAAAHRTRRRARWRSARGRAARDGRARSRCSARSFCRTSRNTTS